MLGHTRPRTHTQFSLPYLLQAEGTKVEFETEKDESGKLKAVNVTGVGGALLVPPKREKRRQRKPKKEAEGSGGEGGETINTNGGKGRQNGKKKKEPVKKEPPFHDVIKPDIRTKITDKGLKLVRNTVDISLGDSRIKLGQGGYASLVDASGMIGEGSYTCDENAKVVFAWERCLEFAGGKWQKADVSKLVASLCLTDGKNTNMSYMYFFSKVTRVAWLTCVPSSLQMVFLLLSPMKLQSLSGGMISPIRRICSQIMASK